MRRSVGLALALLAAAPAPAAARETVPGPITAEVVAVVDGDTVAVRARIWLGQSVETTVRIDGIDAPERRGRCAAERIRAEAARAFVVDRIGAAPVVLRNVRFGKYAGRVLARVEAADGADLATALIAAGHARVYAGGTRGGWCDG